jgi:outer membrane protein OmpA-like peptidoglycan-associated protein
MLINGRTPEQWAAYDRAKLIGAVALVAVLVVLWLGGRGPGRAAACCGLPEAAAVVTPPTRPSAAVPEAAPIAAPTPDPACAGALDTQVLFDTNSVELTSEGRAQLDRLAPCWPGGRFEVMGHADGSGTEAINQTLSERRAGAVVEQLVRRGVAASALAARGYGSSRPTADDATPEGRARNRRASTVVVLQP